jgi:hypothetical protein
MQEAIAPALAAWESFYVIVGSSGAALTGLQFVVIALVADSRMRGSGQTIDAFGTPTVVHFCVVLFLAAVLSSPWHSLASVAVVLAVCGLAGLGYAALVIRRARRQRDYKPVLEDWLWHAAFPVLAYGALFVAGVVFARHTESALFVIGAVAMLLLYIGIHNAWDTVTYIAIQRRNSDEADEASPASAAPATAAAPAAGD